MSKDEFVARFGDEMTGLLLAAFAACDQAGVKRDEAPVAVAAAGNFFIKQQRRARQLLSRMWEAMHTAVKADEQPQSPQLRRTP